MNTLLCSDLIGAKSFAYYFKLYADTMPVISYHGGIFIVPGQAFRLRVGLKVRMVVPVFSAHG